MQPDKPLMVMEWWTGWFDTWAKTRHNNFPSEGKTRKEEKFSFRWYRIRVSILFKMKNKLISLF